MDQNQCDLVIIGGGPAGHAAALRGIELGARVALVEKDALGGVCVNRGCIPTKFMLEVAHAAKTVHGLKAFGLQGSLEQVDLRKVTSRRKAIIRGLVDGIDSNLRMVGVDVQQGTARFEGPRQIIVTGPDGGERRIAARKVVVATGSLPIPATALGVEEQEVVAGERAFEIEHIPDDLLVIGGGAVGLELAAIYNALGSRVTVVEKLPRLLPREDTEMAGFLKEMLEQSGVSFELNAVVSDLHVDENGNKVVEISNGQRVQRVSVQEVIVAHGRTPNVAGLGLDRIGVALDNGAVKTSARMETSVEGVYAAGDVAGGPMLAHVASAQARVAVDNALGIPSTFSQRVVPRCIYTFPELACVGLTEEEAIEKGLQVKVGTSSLATNARAATMSYRDGLVKVIAEARHGDIVGVHILGPLATEMIAPAVVAVSLECTVGELGRICQAHPTLAETLADAIRAAG